MSLRRSLAWSTSQQIGMIALQLLNMVVLSRLLAPEEVGVFVIALALGMILQSFKDLGLTNYLVNAKELTNEKIRATFGLSILVALLLGSGVFLSREWIQNKFDAQGVDTVLLFLVAVIVVFPFEHIAQALVRRNMRFDFLHHATLIAKSSSVVVSILLALSGFSYLSLAWGMLVEAFVRTLLLVRVESSHLKLRPKFSGFGNMIGFSGWTTASSFASYIAELGEKIVVGATLGLSDAGLFDRANQLPVILRNALVGIFGRVFVSSFAFEIREGREVNRHVERSVQTTTAVVWPLSALLAVTSDDIVRLLFGSGWAEAGEVLPYLLLSRAILSLLTPPDQILIPYGCLRRLLLLRIFQIIVVVGTALITSRWGLGAVAVGTIVSAIIYTLASWLCLRTWLATSGKQLLRIYWSSAIVTVAFVLPASGLLLYLSNTPDFVAMFFSFIAGVIVWLAMLKFLDHPLWKELIRFFSYSKITGRR